MGWRQAAVELDMDKRKALYAEFQQIVVGEVPIYFINANGPYHHGLLTAACSNPTAGDLEDRVIRNGHENRVAGRQLSQGQRRPGGGMMPPACALISFLPPVQAGFMSAVFPSSGGCLRP